MKTEIFAGNEPFLAEPTEGVSWEIEACEEGEGVTLYKVVAHCDGNANGTAEPCIKLEWSEMMRGNMTIWSPGSTRNRRRNFNMWCFAPKVESDFYNGTPILSVIHPGDVNFYTVAIEDSFGHAALRAYGNDIEESGRFRIEAWLYPGRKEVYTTSIRVDRRRLPFYECLRDVAGWWNGCYPRAIPLSDACERPLYSDWYNFYQAPDQAKLEIELECAARAGMKTIIIDDGWSYDAPTTGDYYYSGDWEFSRRKFPDPEGFVRRAHALGLKVLLWFPVPFIGYGAKSYERYVGRYYYKSDEFRASVLDVRYPSVRRDVIGTYLEVSKRYDLDGLKLDFVDYFEVKGDGVMLESTGAEERDCPEMRDGVSALMRGVSDALRGYKPDFMIEFRQGYIGRAITGYCNMLRVGDCFMDAVTNRISAVDLRLLGLELAVHSDMLWWPEDDPPEVCARHLINVMFSVPQVSVTLSERSPEQVTAVGAFLHFWDKHRKTILHGKFGVRDVVANYSEVFAEDEKCRISALYVKRVAETVAGKENYVFNATESDGLVVDLAEESDVMVYDCLGQKVFRYALTFAPGLHSFDVPIGGQIGTRRTSGEKTQE